MYKQGAKTPPEPPEPVEEAPGDGGVPPLAPEEDEVTPETSTLPLIYVTLLSNKSEAPNAIKHLLAQINNDHANYPTELVFRLHSDQGGEFMSIAMGRLCTEFGLTHETSSTQDSPQNGTAEKAIQDIMRDTRAALAQSGLSLGFWGLAFEYAAISKNWRPCASNPDMASPYYMRYGHHPDYGRMQPFGQHFHSLVSIPPKRQ